MKTSRRFVVATAAAAALGLVLAGCNGNGTDDSDDAQDSTVDDADTDDADPEDTDAEALVLYSGRDEALIGPLIDDFTAETGIEVDVRYGSTPEMASQLVEEGDSSPADVYLGQDAGSLGAVSAAGVFAVLPDETLDQVPEEFHAEDGTWVGLSGRARVLGYSSASVEESELPDSVLDLTDPQWSGRVGIAPTNASFQSFVTALRVTEGDDAALAWLEGMAANDPQIYDGNGAIVADLENDSVDVGLINHYYVYGTADEQGVEVEDLNVQLHFFSDGDIGGLLNVAGIGIVGDSADGEALELVNFMLSPGAQEWFRDNNSEYPVVEGVAPSDHLPALEELEIPEIDLNDLGDLERTVELITQAGLA